MNRIVFYLHPESLVVLLTCAKRIGESLSTLDLLKYVFKDNYRYGLYRLMNIWSSSLDDQMFLHLVRYADRKNLYFERNNCLIAAGRRNFIDAVKYLLTESESSPGEKAFPAVIKNTVIAEAYEAGRKDILDEVLEHRTDKDCPTEGHVTLYYSEGGLRIYFDVTDKKNLACNLMSK
jgi:hypothetical protein